MAHCDKEQREIREGGRGKELGEREEELVVAVDQKTHFKTFACRFLSHHALA